MRTATNQNDSTIRALRKTLATVAIAAPALAFAIQSQSPIAFPAAGAQTLFGAVSAAGLLALAAMDWKRSRHAVR